MAHTQVWPEFLYLAAIAPSIADSRSASSNTINGAWPPNSSDTLLTVSAEALSNFFPVAVDPVKVSFLTAELLSIALPKISASLIITLNKPFGRPASFDK